VPRPVTSHVKSLPVVATNFCNAVEEDEIPNLPVNLVALLIAIPAPAAAVAKLLGNLVPPRLILITPPPSSVAFNFVYTHSFVWD